MAVYNSLTYYYLDKGLPDKAYDCIMNKAIPIALKIHNDDWLATLYDTYADILAAKKEYKQGLEFEKKSNTIQQSVFASKNKQQIRLLTALLDLKNKELTIQNTNLELQKKTNQNKILIITLLLSILILIIGTVIFRTSRQKAELQLKQEQITSARRIIELQETERTIIGQDLHDNIGYLVRIINGVFQSIDTPDKKFKSEISGKIVELEDHVRRISHRMSILNIDDYSDFKELAEDIINDFSNITGIKINYYIQEQIPSISGEIKIHLSRIIQELLTNSAKYAPDADIKIDIACETETVLIIYKDNGPGFIKENKTRKAIGLTGIQERVKLLGGNAILNTGVGLGTSWEISIPI
jgi:signal transduction histidine kinase